MIFYDPHLHLHPFPAMDQRYVETVRACKAILRNLSHLDDSITDGQRSELNRLLFKVKECVEDFLMAEESDDGLWIGEK